jgi:hypothetical protein
MDRHQNESIDSVKKQLLDLLPPLRELDVELDWLYVQANLHRMAPPEHLAETVDYLRARVSTIDQRIRALLS